MPLPSRSSVSTRPLPSGAVGTRIAEGVGLLPGFGPAVLVPEPERVQACTPDLALGDFRFLVEDAEPPGPAVGVGAVGLALGID